MAPLNKKGDLACAQIAFFAPAFCVGLYVLFKQGFSKKLGWFYLVTLSILRLIGGSCTIYAQVNQDYNDNLMETAAITEAIGTAPLLLVLMGFLERIHSHMLEGKGVHRFIFQGLHLFSLGGLILAIIGGVDLSSATNPASSEYKTGKACMEAGSIFFLTLYLADAVITILTYARSAYVPKTEMKLVYAGLASLPFLFVRVMYTVLVSFQADPRFFFAHVDVWVQAFMQFFMEAIAVTFFIVAGLLTPRMEPTPAAAATYGGRPDMESYAKSPTDVNVQHHAYDVNAEEQHQYTPERRQKNLMDYRPSKLIKEAISKRL